jgi:hypothetical protein
MSRTGIAAARRKFTPEFINRLDKIVVFKSLGNEELRRIVDIELEMVQQRIQTAAAGKPFQVNVTGSAREFLLMEGTDFRYGARPLNEASPDARTGGAPGRSSLSRCRIPRLMRADTARPISRCCKARRA